MDLRVIKRREDGKEEADEKWQDGEQGRGKAKCISTFSEI